MSSKKFSTIGWQGINLTVPSGWNLTEVSGNYQAGYLKISDLKNVRCEIKWEETKSVPNLKSLLKNYFNKMKKVARKQNLKIKIEEDIKSLNETMSVGNRAFLTFAWEARTKAVGFIGYCPICRRVLIMQVLSPQGETEKSMIYSIFSSLKDHSEDNLNLWSLHGLEVKIPQDYYLRKSILQSGLVQLDFQNKKNKLVVRRYALANVVLKGKTLEEWFTKNFLRVFREYETKEKEVKIKGHPGWKVEGKLSPGVRALWGQVRLAFGLLGDRVYPGRLPSSLVPSKLSNGVYLALLWHCPDSNRICMLENQAEEEVDPRIGEIIEGWKCH